MAERTDLNVVFIMRVLRDKIVDYCIVVNARNNIKIDSTETFPIRLNLELLQQCGGSNVKGLSVREMLGKPIK